MNKKKNTNTNPYLQSQHLSLSLQPLLLLSFPSLFSKSAMKYHRQQICFFQTNTQKRETKSKETKKIRFLFLMENRIRRLTVCFTGKEGQRKHHEIPVLLSDPSDEGLGHSFCYVRPDPTRLSSSKVHSEEETMMFKTIFGFMLVFMFNFLFMF